MIYFIKNIVTFFAAFLLTLPILFFGIPYSIGHSIYISFKERSFKIFFYMFRLFDGLLYSLGYLLFHIAKFFDILWCVLAGEMFEDMVTAREHTMFGTFTTISEATGKEQKEGFLTPFGVWFTKLLNKAFGQAQHCLDAFELGIKRKELESKYYKK